MEQNIQDWMAKNEVDEKEMNEVDNMAFENARFEEDTLNAASWTLLCEKVPSLVALSLQGCNLKKIEDMPEKVECDLEILDVGNNPLEDLSFVKSCKRVVSLHLGKGSQLKTFEDLDALKAHPSLKVIELEENLLGAENEEEFRKKVFEKLPSLLVLNGRDPAGDEVEEEEDDISGLDEIEGLTEEQIEALMQEGSDDEEEEDEDEDEDEGEEEEPPAKKQKKE